MDRFDFNKLKLILEEENVPLSTGTTETMRKAKLSMKALEQFKLIFDACETQDQFNKLFINAIMEDSSTIDINALFDEMIREPRGTTEEEKKEDEIACKVLEEKAIQIQKDYQNAIAEFSREYMASLVPELPTELLVKFAADAICTNHLNVEFVDRMKFDADAPIKLRNQELKGNWSHETKKLKTDEQEKEIKEEEKDEEAKPWYEIEFTQEEQLAEMVRIAERLAASNSVDAARVFKSAANLANSISRNNVREGLKDEPIRYGDKLLTSSICLFKSILCSIVIEDDILTTEKEIHYYIQEEDRRLAADNTLVLSKHNQLIGSVWYPYLCILIIAYRDHNLDHFSGLVVDMNKNGVMDSWMTSMMLTLKNRIISYKKE